MLAPRRLRLYIVASDVWPESKAPTSQAVPGLGFVIAKKLVVVNTQGGEVVRLEAAHVDALVLQLRGESLHQTSGCRVRGERGLNPLPSPVSGLGGDLLQIQETPVRVSLVALAAVLDEPCHGRLPDLAVDLALRHLAGADAANLAEQGAVVEREVRVGGLPELDQGQQTQALVGQKTVGAALAVQALREGREVAPLRLAAHGDKVAVQLLRLSRW